MKRSAPFGAALAVVLSLAAMLGGIHASPVNCKNRPNKKRTFRYNVNLVSILASVLDASGRPVLDLPKDAFEIYEEGA